MSSRFDLITSLLITETLERYQIVLWDQQEVTDWLLMMTMGGDIDR
jgi:hypothetical protein